MKSKIIIGSRSSRLAVLQAEEVKTQLLSHFPGLQIELYNLTTEGDRTLDLP
ncbi:MAG: hydroxymethylbilane synthase, partial [Candidatus Omnitrophica bacterium]|nr:hydroxymethylbilane synthase [Candidatus Omnitrophota bacterium]